MPICLLNLVVGGSSRAQTRSLLGSRPEVMLRNALAPGPSSRSRDKAQHTEFILKSVARINQTMYEDQMVVPEWPSELEEFNGIQS